VTDLAFLPLTDLAALVRDRSLSPVELVQHTLDRIARGNPTLNALVSVDPELALRDAAALAERIAHGEDPGPLAGIPLAVKDLEDARGFPTSRGTSAFRDSPAAAADSVHVARLRAAGAVVVAKTNTPPLGAAVHTANDAFGISRNPWNPDLSPGGSSGGSAAAVAAGLVPFATAGDGGGSTRIPAALCGIVGIKPTRGRIPQPSGAVPNWAHNTCATPMTRTVRDAALHLDVAAGHHPRDPFSLPAPATSYQDALATPLPRLRIAVNPTLGVAEPQPALRQALETAADLLARLGHEIVEDHTARPDAADFADALLLRQQVLAHRRYQTLADTFAARADAFEPWLAAAVERGRAVTTEELTRYWHHRGRVDAWAAGLFDHCDLLLTPTTPTTAWPAEGPDTLAMFRDRTLPVAFTAAFNDTGNPAVSVPVGLSPEGLPCAVQLVGPHHPTTSCSPSRPPWKASWACSGRRRPEPPSGDGDVTGYRASAAWRPARLPNTDPAVSPEPPG
jgi:Asp-tRNA(Asn)/Glu-tRNA(Gln) amidotransferase A subunit family amidase